VLHGERLDHLMRIKLATSNGTTGLASHGGRLNYSTTETYEIGEGGVEKLFGPHPMTRRVVTAY
jgi:hypothetical protein